MTVSADDGRKQYPGNGVAVEFTAPKVFSSDQLRVYLSTGAASLLLSEGTHYDVELVGSSQSRVRMIAAPAVGETLIIMREISTAQTTNITNQRAFLPEVIEDEFDRMAMRLQQLQVRVDRSLRLADDVPVSAVTSSLDNITPLAPVVINEDGTGFTMGSTDLTGDMLLRPSLADDAADKGAALVAFPDAAAPAYLKTVSDILNGVPVSILRNIPRSRWAGIQARTDTEDCAAAIMDLMDGAYAARQVVLRVPNGTFTIHQPIQRLAGTAPFRLVGDDWRRSIITRGSDWAASAGTGSVFNITGVDSHSIENLRIIGNNALYPLNGNHAIACSNSNHVTYRKLYIEDWKNSGILVFHYPGSPAPDTPQEQNNVIEDCYLAGGGNANNGILFVDQFYSYMRGCTVRDLGKTGTPQSALQFKNRCYRSHIHDCVAVNARHGVAFGQEDVPGIAAEQCSATNVLVKDCVWGIYMGSSAYSTIDNINIDMAGQGSHGIEMTDAIENSFTNIYIRGKLNGSGQRAVKFGGTSARNRVQFAVLEDPDTIPEIALYESGTSNNVVRVGLYKGAAALTYTGQGKLDQTAAPSGNSLVIEGYETQEFQTISAGVVLVKDPATQTVRVDTEASAVTDDLDTITGNGRDGQKVTLRTVNAGRDVVVKHGTGNIFLKGGIDVTLSFLQSRINLQYDSGANQWVEF